MKHRYATSWMLLMLVAPIAPLQAADPPASGADVLALAPADCWGAISVRNLSEMDKKLMTLVQQLNLPIPMPPNPLTMGLSTLGFMSGLDPAGSVGVVVLAASTFEDMEKSTVLLVPTTDMKQLLSLMEPQKVCSQCGGEVEQIDGGVKIKCKDSKCPAHDKEVNADGGISKVMVQGQESYVAPKDKHAVLGKSVKAVNTVLENKSSVRSKLAPEQVEHCAADDLVIWVNAEGVTASEAFKSVMPMLQMAGMDPEMFKEMRTLIASLRLSPAGVRLGLFADSMPDTPSYKIHSSQKGSSESLLVGLPKERCVLSCGTVSSKEASEQGAAVIDKMLQHPQIQSLPLDQAKLGPVKELLTSMFKPLRALSFAVSGLPEGPEGLITLTKVVRVEGDPKALLTSVAQLIGQIKGGLITSEEAAPFLAALEYKPAAETIDGIAVDHILFDMAKVAPASESGPPPEIEAVKKVVGKDGLLFRVGVVGSDAVISTFGGGADRFKAVAELVKAKQSPLAEDGGVKRSQTHLPAKKNMELYIAVDRLLAVVTTVAKAVEAPLPPLSMPELNAPIAMASAPAGKGGSQTEIFLPMELMIAVKDVAMNAMGGGPAGGGEPPPAGGEAPPAGGDPS